MVEQRKVSKQNHEIRYSQIEEMIVGNSVHGLVANYYNTSDNVANQTNNRHARVNNYSQHHGIQI